MVLFLDVVTIVSAAVLVGNEAAVWIFINPILRQLDEGSQGRAVSLFAARLGKAMPFWYAFSLLLLILEAFLRRQGSGGAVVGREAGVGAGETRVLELVAADRHSDVVGTAGDSVSRLTQRL